MKFLRRSDVEEGDVVVSDAPQQFLAIENLDRPGTIGRVGTLIGQRGVNISSMSVSPGEGGRALMLLGIERALTEPELADVKQLDGIDEVRQIQL